MSGESLVQDAQKWANDIVMREYSGPGQMERAIEKASIKTGIDRQVFWSLRYRPPKDMFVSVYMRLKAAYEAECERQERLYEEERAIANAINSNVVRTADFVAGRKAREAEKQI